MSELHLGQTNYYGQNANRSYHGHTISRLKSLMQKSVRRGDVELIPWIAFEISSFHHLYKLAQHFSSSLSSSNWEQFIKDNQDDIDRIATKKERKESPGYSQAQWITWAQDAEKKIASALRNILHRVLIISVEDCFNIWGPHSIEEDMAALFAHPEHDEYAIILTRVLYRLVYSSRIRLTSDLKTVYLLMMDNKPFNANFVAQHKLLQEDPGSFHLEGDLGMEVKNVLDTISDEDKNFTTEIQAEVLEKINTAKSEGKDGLYQIQNQSSEIQRCALGIIYHLQQESDLAFYWVKQLMEIKLLTTPIHRKKKSIYLIWHILENITQLEPPIPKKIKKVDDESNEQRRIRKQVNRLHKTISPRRKMINLMISTLKSWYDDGNLGGVKDSAGKAKSYILPEANLFLYYGIAIYVRRNLQRTDGSFVLDTEPMAETNLALESLKKNQADIDKYREQEPVIPGYAKDMHDKSSKSIINGQIKQIQDDIKEMTPVDLRTYLHNKIDLLESFHSHRGSFESLKEKINNNTVTLHDIQSFLSHEKRNSTHFARYGAFIEGENKLLFVAPYRTIYDALKGVYHRAEPSETVDTVEDDQKKKPASKQKKEKGKSDLEVEPQVEPSVEPQVEPSVKSQVESTSDITVPSSDEKSPSLLLPDIFSIFVGQSEVSEDTLHYPLYSIRLEQEAQIQQAVRGQKLCGKGKIPVLVFRHHIIKGPYNLSHSGQARKFFLNLANNRALEYLETALALPENKKTSQPLMAILKVQEDKTSTSHRFIVFQNLGSQKVKLMTPEEADTKIETGKRIACRGSLIDSVADYLDKTKTSTSHQEEVVQATLQHFYLRYLLGIGDSNLRNIIVRRDYSPPDQPRSVAGIDMEEIRGSYAPEGSKKLTILLGNENKKGLPKHIFREILKKQIASINIFSPEDLIPGDILEQVAQFYQVILTNADRDAWKDEFQKRVEVYYKNKK